MHPPFAIITLASKALFRLNAYEVSISKPAINVVVSCTARKTMQAPRESCLHAIKGASLERRLQLWLQRIYGAPCDAFLEARRLYCGDAWSVVQSALEANSQRASASLWIASAGYGLIGATERIRPYSATFMAGHKDSISVRQDRAACAAWWAGLSQSSHEKGRQISSIQALAKCFPSTPLLIALSESYIAALADDLVDARRHLCDPDLLVIVSAGSSKRGILEEHFLPCDARLEHRFGGARSSLNSRIVRHILQTTEPENVRCSLLKKRFSRMLGKLPKHRTFDRSKMTDQEVTEFIVQNLRACPDATQTSLLRQLRDNLRACEQKRFRRIYLTIKGSPISPA